ncbi:MAG: hypothetical protein R6U63_04415 [Longimicrobiales bacterium]
MLAATLMVPAAVAAQAGTGAGAAPLAWLSAAGLASFRGAEFVGASILVAPGAGALFPADAELDIGGIVRFRRLASAYGDARLMVLCHVGGTGALAS